jgi:hypothetical protein
MDRILLNGLVFFGRHGCLDAERELGQKFWSISNWKPTYAPPATAIHSTILSIMSRFITRRAK